MRCGSVTDARFFSLRGELFRTDVDADIAVVKAHLSQLDPRPIITPTHPFAQGNTRSRFLGADSTVSMPLRTECSSTTVGLDLQ